MFGQVGLPELIVVLVIALLSLIWVWPVWRIVSKTGHPGVLTLLFLIPIVNLGMLFYLAFSEWPIEREIRRLRPPA